MTSGYILENGKFHYVTRAAMVHLLQAAWTRYLAERKEIRSICLPAPPPRYQLPVELES
jgi:hypothetical protein